MPPRFSALFGGDAAASGVGAAAFTAAGTAAAVAGSATAVRCRGRGQAAVVPAAFAWPWPAAVASSAAAPSRASRGAAAAWCSFLSASPDTRRPAVPRRGGVGGEACHSSFLDNACLCEPVGSCTPPDASGHLRCPSGQHVDRSQCRERRVFQTIAGYSCSPPPQQLQLQRPGGPQAAGTEPALCALPDTSLTHFKRPSVAGEAKADAVTCLQLKALGACDDPARPALTAKVREDCPCSCGVSPPAVVAPERPEAGQERAAQLRRAHRCWKDDWDVAEHLELLEKDRRIYVGKLDSSREIGCGVNKSPLRPNDGCPAQRDISWPSPPDFKKTRWVMITGEQRPDPVRDEQGCTGNPAYDDGVRTGSELISVRWTRLAPGQVEGLHAVERAGKDAATVESRGLQRVWPRLQYRVFMLRRAQDPAAPGGLVRGLLPSARALQGYGKL